MHAHGRDFHCSMAFRLGGGKHPLRFGIRRVGGWTSLSVGTPDFPRIRAIVRIGFD
jgi:hypothetical protein